MGAAMVGEKLHEIGNWADLLAPRDSTGFAVARWMDSLFGKPLSK
jgi:hypothetical protein